MTMPSADPMPYLQKYQPLPKANATQVTGMSRVAATQAQST